MPSRGAGKGVALEEQLQRLGQALDVHDLALAHEAGHQVHARGTGDRAAGDLHGGNVGSIDIETDRPAGRLLVESDCHWAYLVQGVVRAY